jgi:hypothetical protein
VTKHQIWREENISRSKHLEFYRLGLSFLCRVPKFMAQTIWIGHSIFLSFSLLTPDQTCQRQYPP